MALIFRYDVEPVSIGVAYTCDCWQRNGWFNSSSNQLQEITVGGLKIDSEVSQLVQAMATYAANNPGFDPTSSSTTAVLNDPSLQSTMSAAWHA